MLFTVFLIACEHLYRSSSSFSSSLSLPHLFYLSVICSFLFALHCYLLAIPFSVSLLVLPFLKWMPHRGHAHPLYPRPESPVLSSPFSCTFWHLLDLLLLLWSPTSVPQPRRCPPLSPAWLGPCPSVQPVCSTQLAPPRGDWRWCADLWHLLLPGWSWEVRAHLNNMTSTNIYLLLV